MSNLGVPAPDRLDIKKLGNRDGDPRNSDRGRRSDLVRWAGVFLLATGGTPLENSVVGGDPLLPWSHITPGKLADVQVLAAALGPLAEDGLAVTSRKRMSATLSGWCSWLTRRDHLAFDPTIDDEIVIRSSQRDLDGKAFTLGEVDRLLAVSSRPPGGKVRSAWAARDVAIMSFLAYCGQE